ncbi:hypothetical protein FPZ49_19155 [Paenibacillus cremeus]|uniref:Uncharacterized protein n=1 Tax=Paenibacillus cremeus TaxID=2163881 RepID=A0A559K8F2_9BACL|nr:hypothetical protein FPZ49_19155 [Paenibacillus cremeus]
MTINKGAIKKKVVLDFMNESINDWVCEDGIDLGYLPSIRSITSQDIEDFIFRVFLYATLREKLRSKFKPRKKMPMKNRQIVKHL